MTDKKYAVKEGVIYGAIEGLLNIRFTSDNDARLCCKLLNRKEKRIQEYIDDLDEIFKWHKEHYGKSVLDERMEFKSDCEKENEQLKTENQQLFDWINSKMIYYEELIEKTEGFNNVSAKGHLDMLIKLKKFIENSK